MELFDKDGNFVGEFISSTKENVEETFESSWILGILFFLISPIWTMVVISIWFIFKMFIKLLIFVLRIAWWIIRLPFCLIFLRELPKFKESTESYY